MCRRSSIVVSMLNTQLIGNMASSNSSALGYNEHPDRTLLVE